MSDKTAKPVVNAHLKERIIEKCTRETQEFAEERPGIPMETFLGEAALVAGIIEDNFETRFEGGRTYRGLDSVAEATGVTLEEAGHISDLVFAVGSVHNDYLVLLQKLSQAPVERAEFLLKEFRAFLGLVLEDGNHPTGEAQLERLWDEYGDEESHAGLALALQGYVELAQEHADLLSKIAGYDTAVVDEALQLSVALRERARVRVSGELALKQRALLAQRDRMVAALKKKVSAARRAIRFVFRDRPEIVRKATSNYRREANRRYRSRQAAGSKRTEELVLTAPQA